MPIIYTHRLKDPVTMHEGDSLSYGIDEGRAGGDDTCVALVLHRADGSSELLAATFTKHQRPFLIKPLDWKHRSSGLGVAPRWVADVGAVLGDNGHYEIMGYHDGMRATYACGRNGHDAYGWEVGVYRTMDRAKALVTAKAACQADYEVRVTERLERIKRDAGIVEVGKDWSSHVQLMAGKLG